MKRAHQALKQKHEEEVRGVDYGPSVLPRVWTQALNEFVRHYGPVRSEQDEDWAGQPNLHDVLMLVQLGVLALPQYSCTLPESRGKMRARPDSSQVCWQALCHPDTNVTDRKHLLRMAIEDRVESLRAGRRPKWMDVRGRGRQPAHLALSNQEDDRDLEFDRQFQGEVGVLAGTPLQLGRLKCLTNAGDLRRLNCWFNRLLRHWDEEMSRVNRHVNSVPLRSAISAGVGKLIAGYKEAMRRQVRSEVFKEAATVAYCFGERLGPAMRRCRVEMNCLGGKMVFQLELEGSGRAEASLARCWPKMQGLEEELQAVTRLTRIIRTVLRLGRLPRKRPVARAKALASKPHMTASVWSEFKSVLSDVLESSDDEEPGEFQLPMSQHAREALAKTLYEQFGFRSKQDERQDR